MRPDRVRVGRGHQPSARGFAAAAGFDLRGRTTNSYAASVKGQTATPSLTPSTQSERAPRHAPSPRRGRSCARLSAKPPTTGGRYFHPPHALPITRPSRPRTVPDGRHRDAFRRRQRDLRAALGAARRREAGARSPHGRSGRSCCGSSGLRNLARRVGVGSGESMGRTRGAFGPRAKS
jgi:hypothetical protein